MCIYSWSIRYWKQNGNKLINSTEEIIDKNGSAVLLHIYSNHGGGVDMDEHEAAGVLTWGVYNI
jgi:hypothetical protein